VHFEDWFDGGEMRFDYLMKPGPVTHSNALALMRAVGLDVGPAPPALTDASLLTRRDDGHDAATSNGS